MIAGEKRKSFTTTIKPSIWQEFKVACVKNRENMNDVLEVFMQLYSQGKVRLPEKEKK